MVTVSRKSVFPWTTTSAMSPSLKGSVASRADTTDWMKNHMIADTVIAKLTVQVLLHTTATRQEQKLCVVTRVIATIRRMSMDMHVVTGIELMNVTVYTPQNVMMRHITTNVVDIVNTNRGMITPTVYMVTILHRVLT